MQELLWKPLMWKRYLASGKEALLRSIETAKNAYHYALNNHESIQNKINDLITGNTLFPQNIHIKTNANKVHTI
ncbi:hypothetical protein BSK66_11695 [Paenibacillus odorifer]|nr:hypothetical protein C171_00950 [Paenibacillus sp. FSL H8-237]OME58790.1 hypothetical protein BSK66_11695 [Paenibacillus odorifer]